MRVGLISRDMCPQEMYPMVVFATTKPALPLEILFFAGSIQELVLDLERDMWGVMVGRWCR